MPYFASVYFECILLLFSNFFICLHQSWVFMILLKILRITSKWENFQTRISLCTFSWLRHFYSTSIQTVPVFTPLNHQKNSTECGIKWGFILFLLWTDCMYYTNPYVTFLQWAAHYVIIHNFPICTSIEILILYLLHSFFFISEIADILLKSIMW